MLYQYSDKVYAKNFMNTFLAIFYITNILVLFTALVLIKEFSLASIFTIILTILVTNIVLITIESIIEGYRWTTDTCYQLQNVKIEDDTIYVYLAFNNKPTIIKQYKVDKVNSIKINRKNIELFGDIINTSDDKIITNIQIPRIFSNEEALLQSLSEMCSV